MKIEHAKRRTVLKGAAWSVPVVTLAAAGPAAAASGQDLTLAISDLSARYIEAPKDDRQLIASTATVTVVTGSWPQEPVLLKKRFWYAPGGGPSGYNEYRTLTGQETVVFANNINEGVGLTKYSVLVFLTSDTNNPIARSELVDIIPFGQ